jgi:hypothetical protein
MTTCTRYSKTTRRRCRRDAAGWPGQRIGPGQPSPDWPDLPSVVACWSHLSEAERAMCLEARRRERDALDKEHLARQEQLAYEEAERRAAGIPEPPAWQQPEPRLCVGTCISQERATGRDSDGAMVSCANCDEYVCVGCGQVRVDQPLASCGPCYDRAAEAEYGVLPEAEPEHAPPGLRAELNELATQIVTLGGGPGYPWVHNALNRRMRIGQRDDATAEQLHSGIRYARDWVALLRS